MDEDMTETPPAGGGPVSQFWEWFKKKRKEENERDKELGKAVARGVTGAVVETGKTIAAGAAWVDRKTGLGEAIQPGFNERYDEVGAKGISEDATDPLQRAREQYLGKRSDDWVAQLTEDTAQFLTSFAALGQVRVAKGGAKIAQLGWKAAAARGAVTDATAFDPYEEQLAELAARSDIPGLDLMGELLSVDSDDDEVTARIKRSTAGVILGTTIDGLIAAAGRIKWGRKALAAKTPSERAAAEAKVAEYVRQMDELHTPSPEKPFVVRVNDDETATILSVADGADPVVGPTFPSIAEAEAQANSMTLALKDVDPEVKPTTTPNIAETLYKRLRSFGEPGEIPDEDLFGIAGETLREIAPQDRTRVLAELSQDARVQSVVEVMAKAHSLNLGKRLADLDYVLEARPHDPVAQQDAVEKVMELLSFDNFRKWVQGETGRRLRIIGRQDDPLMEAVRQQQRAVDDPALPVAERKVIQEVEDISDAQDAIDEILAETDEALGAADDAAEGASKNRTDTNAVTATDFSLARARQKAERLLEKLTKGSKLFEHDPELAVQRADAIKSAADAQRAEPLVPTAEEVAAAAQVKTKTTNPIEELSKWLDSFDNDLEKKLNPEPTPPKEQKQKLYDEVSPITERVRQAKEGKKKLKALYSILDRANKQLDESLRRRAAKLPKEQKQKLYDEVSPISERLKRGTPAAQLKAAQNKARTSTVAGMTPRYAGPLAVNAANVRQFTRMFRMAQGNPNNVTAAIQSTAIIQRGGTLENILEFYTNMLLSNPATAKTVAVSGQLISGFEALGRIGAGALTGNRALAREGIDILFGNYMHMTDNLRIAGKALAAGQSVINPAPVHHAIGGRTGEVIRVPGKVLMGADEFTRVMNYRSFVRAKSLRQGRAMGLSGPRLELHVENDLIAAFDQQTGIATIPDALQYAERSTLSGPLGLDTFGGKFSKLVRETPALAFIAPFLKAGTNVLRFTMMHTPGLHRLNREARAILEAGGEEAAVLRTKQAMASAIYLWGVQAAMAGNVTGDAPGDPALRDLWMKSNQPYSIKVGGKWYSYRRTDPFGMMLGLAADLAQFNANMDELDPEMDQFAIAMISAGATGVLTPTYMKGFSQFLDAFADGTPQGIERWIGQFSSAFIPAGLNAMNSDPYFRETRTIGDMLKAKVPGLSQTLDPKFDLFGEPVLNGGIGNRSALLREKDATPQVEEELMKLGTGFSTFRSVSPHGVDLKDRETFDNGTGVSPYRRMMELIANPENGPSLRKQVEELVASPRYQNASGGTTQYPGGMRWTLVANLRSRAYTRAYNQVLREYPKLRTEEYTAIRLQRGAQYGGEEGYLQAVELFGQLEQKRPISNRRIQQR